MSIQFRAIGLFLLTACSLFFAACGESHSNPGATEKSAVPPATPNNGNSAGGSVAKSQAAFSKTVELHGIKFIVESPNSESGNKVTITPSGLQVTNEGVTKSIEGEVYGAEVGDLNVDQSPEVYVYVRERGGNKHASLVAYAANNRKSISEISFPADDPKSKNLAGFHGEDEFAVVESSLARRFPLFEGTGADVKKTGKMRQFQYKLKQGEAGWVLYAAKVIEF
jgi:hypothetical protein